MEYLSAFGTADGLDLDGARILEKVSLKEVETGAVVPVGIFHAQKELRHTPTSRHVQPKHTRRSRDHPSR